MQTVYDYHSAFSRITRCSLAALPKGNLCLPSLICRSSIL
jgi:hypothetical protein